MRLVCALGLFLALLHLSSSSTSLRVGAFNIKSFGKTKAEDITVMMIISRIVHRYDIILIQEVRDSDLSVTKKLMDHVNDGSSPFRYNYIVSEPLGHSTYKERYLFLYREQIVSVDDWYTYPDTKNVFSRKPFIVMFSSKALKNLVLIPQHTSPDSAVREIDALFDVVVDVLNRWKTTNIMLLGDFNAGCSYVMGPDWPKIRLFTNPSFRWLISDYVDTTVSQTKNAYDRIVVTSDLLTRVVLGSANVYIFPTPTWIEPLDVSDHYPVEVELS